MKLRLLIGQMPTGRFMPVKLGEDIWVVHAFQKKSTKGIKTPKREVDLIRSRISQLKEQLR